MKVIKFNTPKGEYRIALSKVAEHRADYYATERGGHTKNSKEYIQEVANAMSDDFECIDWLINNTNPEDWDEHMVRVSDRVNVTDDDFWCDSDDFEITTL